MGRREGRDRYFQEIARAFFDLRGAPFVLSSKDAVMISSWEDRGIPLRVVLEGIERAFENYRKRPVRSRKMPALSFCEADVLRAFAQFRDRRVGREAGPSPREEKRKKVKVEVMTFLKTVPVEVSYLEDVYRAALKILSPRNAPEEELERLDDRVASLLAQNSSPADAAEAAKRVAASRAGRSARELKEIEAVELVRWMRHKHRVPYLSFFYY